MTTRRISTTLACILVAATSTALADLGRDFGAPIRSTLSLAGETVDLDGSVAIELNRSVDSDGVARIVYACEIRGRASGLASGTQYAVSGVGFGEVRADGQLPADVGVSCAMKVAAAETAGDFRVMLQASLDSGGRLSSLVVREVIATP